MSRKSEAASDGNSAKPEPFEPGLDATPVLRSGKRKAADEPVLKAKEAEAYSAHPITARGTKRRHALEGDDLRRERLLVSDRQAQHRMLRKLRSDQEWLQAGPEQRVALEELGKERLEQQRFQQGVSTEWYDAQNMRKAKQDRDEEEARYDEETRAALQVALSANKTTRAGKAALSSVGLPEDLPDGIRDNVETALNAVIRRVERDIHALKGENLRAAGEENVGEAMAAFHRQVMDPETLSADRVTLASGGTQGTEVDDVSVVVSSSEEEDDEDDGDIVKEEDKSWYIQDEYEADGGQAEDDNEDEDEDNEEADGAGKGATAAEAIVLD